MFDFDWSRLFQDGMVLIIFAYAVGVGGFSAALGSAALLPASDKDEVRIVRRLVSLMKKLIWVLFLLSWPLLYIAAFLPNPAANQDVTLVHKE